MKRREPNFRSGTLTTPTIPLYSKQFILDIYIQKALYVIQEITVNCIWVPVYITQLKIERCPTFENSVQCIVHSDHNRTFFFFQYNGIVFFSWYRIRPHMSTRRFLSTRLFYFILLIYSFFHTFFLFFVCALGVHHTRNAL